jgi:ABC-2 type transport system permease protein
MTTATATEVVRVRVPPRTFRNELRAMKIVWRRELIRFVNDRMRIVTALIQPLLFLFVLGAGLNQLVSAGTFGVDLKTFIYPGILCISVMFTAMFSAASIVWDREFGFLREMMVAPVRRSSIVIGKAFGGATVASFQGVILILLGPLVGVRYQPVLILGILAIQALLAFAITSFGLMVAGLPLWLAVLNRLDPLTYAVDPMRRLVFNHLDLGPAAQHALGRGVTWWGWHVPALMEIAMVALLGVGLLTIAIWEFSSTE